MSGWSDLQIPLILSDPPHHLTKLHTWLTQHPDTKLRFVLREPPSPASDSHHDFYFYAVKSQILEGFEFLAKIERVLTESVFPPVHPPPAHRFPCGRHLICVRRAWRSLCKCHAGLSDVQAIATSLRAQIVIQVENAKKTAVNLISLLTSADAIPSPYVPVVNFANLGPSVPNILRTVALCKRSIRILSDEEGRFAGEISAISGIYSRKGPIEQPEEQVTLLEKLVVEAAQQFDCEHSCMLASFDGSAFADFFSHPNSIGNPILMHFLGDEKEKSLGFKKFTKIIVGQFNFIETSNEFIVNAIVANVYGPEFLPDGAFDGPGTDDELKLNFAFDLLWCDDPLRLLGMMVDAMQGDDAKAAVENAADALKTLTSSGNLVLRFVYEFTNLAYLKPRACEVRAAIAEFLNGNQ